MSYTYLAISLNIELYYVLTINNVSIDRVEHIELYDEKDGKEHVVEFDFLGKDSIR